MSRPAKGARLYLQPERRGPTGKLIERACWIIRDGTTKSRTGFGPHEVDGAGDPRLQEALASYIAEKHSPSRASSRHPARIKIADVLSIYSDDVIAKNTRPEEAARRSLQLLDWWGERTLADINGRSCRAYATARGSASAARRELEDLRAAINHHRREGLCSEIVEVVLPPKSPPRERWLTRDEAARLIWAAWRFREVQKGKVTSRRTRQHVARFILVALYTGTRSAAICGAALKPTEGRGWIDLDRGVFYRRAEGERQTKKRKPPVVLPDRLLASVRRWKRKGLAKEAVIEWNGQPVDAIKKSFARTVADAGLDTRVTPHILRHTAITWAMQNGADLWDAAGYFGLTVETLERVYGHHHPDHQKSAREAVSRSPGQKPDRNSVNKPRQSDSNVVKISRKSAIS